MDSTVQQAVNDRSLGITEKDEAGNLTNEMKTFMNQEKEELRAYSRRQLKFSGNENVPVYCISNTFPERFEFSKLLLDVATYLPEIQKQALTLSTNIFTEDYIRAKKKILEKKIKYYAALSGLVATIPVPGVSFVADVTMIMSVLKFFKEQFDLDYEEDDGGSFHVYAFGAVKSVLPTSKTSSVIFKEIASIGTMEYVTELLLKCAGSEALEQITKIVSIVTLGVASAAAVLIGGNVSYASTYWLLSNELDKIEKLAKEAAKLRIQDML